MPTHTAETDDERSRLVEVVVLNMRLVDAVVHRYRNRGIPNEDFTQMNRLPYRRFNSGVLLWRCRGRQRNAELIPRPSMEVFVPVPVPVPDFDALLDTVERLAATLTGDYAVTEVLRTLAEQAAAVLGVRGVGVVLVGQGRSDVIAPVEAVADLERVRGARPTGPSADAMRSRGPVLVGDLTVGEFVRRWPAYVARAEVGEIRAVAAVPMFAGERVLGALGLYDGTRHSWSDEELRIARIMANFASCYVVHASELETNAQLRTALTSRIVIEQAKGVLAETRGISVDEAFEVLRKHSRDHNAQLHDVAAAVVNLRLRP